MRADESGRSSPQSPIPGPRNRAYAELVYQVTVCKVSSIERQPSSSGLPRCIPLAGMYASHSAQTSATRAQGEVYDSNKQKYYGRFACLGPEPLVGREMAVFRPQKGPKRRSQAIPWNSLVIESKKR